MREGHVRWPVLGASDRDAVLRVLDRGVLSGTFAPEVRALERELAAYFGAKHAVAVNSGTAALHVALVAAGVGAGDEVITTAFSFVATALAIVHAGATPVFVDIEERTWGMDPALIEAAITPRTKAILPVHIHGMPCDLEPILAMARKHDLIVIEDAAQAHGAKLGGRKVGTLGAIGCFSMQSSKNLACGEGGFLITDDDVRLERALATRMFGENIQLTDEAGYDLAHALDGNRAYDSVSVGWMYRLSELPASVARSQLAQLDHWNAGAARNAARLSARLAELPGVSPPATVPGREAVFHKYRVRLDATKIGVDAPPRVVRDAVLKGLRDEGFLAVLWQTQPVPGQTLFRKLGHDPARFPRTQGLLDSSLCLFSHTYPIAPQPPELVEQYAAGFAHVWGRLRELIFLSAGASIMAIVRSRAGRSVLALAGLGLVALVIGRAGPRFVWQALGHAAALMPVVVLCEGAILACSARALWLLYAVDRTQLPIRDYVRASLIACSIGYLVPAGRAIGEAARAALVARHVGAPRAAAAAVRLQGIVLLSVAGISAPAAFALYLIAGWSPITWFCAGNTVLTLVMGVIVLLAGRRSRVGAWLGRKLKREGQGAEFDLLLREGTWLTSGAFGWELLGRVVQVVQNGVLVVAVGGAMRASAALCSEGIHLVGATFGDLVPGQLGATEANYTLFGKVLALVPAQAVTIAIVAHMAQLCWVVVGLAAGIVGNTPRDPG